MRKAATFLLIIFGGLVGTSSSVSCMEAISGDTHGADMDIVTDTYFMSGVLVDVAVINVKKSLRIESEKYAEITSDIYVCDKCNVSVKNAGVMSGKIHVGSNANLVQLIYERSDMTALNVDASYTMLADGAQNLIWHDLYEMGENAGRLILHNTSLVIDKNISERSARVAQPYVELYGVITLNLPDDFVIRDMPITGNVSGDANIVVAGGMAGPLYAYAAWVRDENLYLSLVRETDYYKILGTSQGRLLNKIREIMPGDALLQKLDSAQDMGEIRHIMSHSIAFNPIRLMRPVRMLDSIMSSDVRMNMPAEQGTSDVTMRPFYLWENDWGMYGASADMLMRPTKDTVMGLSFYGAMVESDDAVNTFSGQIFGGRVSGVYDNNAVMMRMTGGLSQAYFDVPYIFDGDEIRTNARGHSLYTVADIGHRFGVFVPYVGGEYHISKMMEQDNVDVAGRAGIETGFAVHGIEVRYDYKFTAGVNTASVLQAGGGVRVVSPDDMLGGDITLNVIKDKDETGWMVSASARMLF